MIREKVLNLLINSMKENYITSDYSKVYYLKIANKFRQGSFKLIADDKVDNSFSLTYIEAIEFNKLYNEAIPTEERFNRITIYFDKEGNPTATFEWDQAFYDNDIALNKKYKKPDIKKAKELPMMLQAEFQIDYLNPVHINYPSWPGGERWLQLYKSTTGTQIVNSKGLSDTVDFAYEIYLETNDLMNPEDFGSSWQANLVYEAGRVFPRVNNLKSRLETNTYLTLQIDIEGAPSEWSLNNPNGNIGLFVGLPSKDLNDFSFFPLNIKLMRPTDLIYAIENDLEGRLRLASLYTEQGNPTISALERESVV